MTISLIIAFVALLSVRLLLEWLAGKYDIFESWFLVANIALIVISVFLLLSLVTQITKQIIELRNAFPPKSETSRAGIPRERGNAPARENRRALRAKKRAEKKAYRDKIRRVEAYEKRFWSDRGEK